jgi:hypothetical protein
MDQNDTAGSAGEHGRPLGRGLADVSHLFLSRKTSETPTGDRAAAPSSESSPPPGGRGAGVNLRPASVTREGLAAILMGLDSGLEDGVRAIDARIPCHPCGEIDLLAVDRARQLTIIDFETTVNDGLLLRGLGHFDWVSRNMPIVERMYQAQAVDFSLPARLLLLAPQFSPLVRRVVRQIIRPQIHWVRYHTLDVSGGPGILFEPVVGD